MELKQRYLLYLMALFAIVVFLDQNSVPVPVKMLVGPAFQIELSIIVVLSMVIGSLLTIAGLVMVKRMKERRRERNGDLAG